MLTTLKASVVCLTKRRSKTTFRSHTTNDEMRDCLSLQLVQQCCLPKGSFAWLVNHDLAWQGLQFVNNIMPMLPSNE